MKSLKEMSFEELNDYAKSIRDNIIKSTSVNGGHLSSNLGVVELTMAIHRNFDIENDTLIFDVSHQCYTHKLLTGRSLDFLRKMDGVSGFSNPKESQYDMYALGHSSTSISIAIGEAIRNKVEGIVKNIIVVIGDASISNGVAIEALNYLGTLKDIKVIVIINDNNKGISYNVGSIAKTLNNVRIKRHKVTKSGNLKYTLLDRIKMGIKGSIYDKSIFDSFNLKYFSGIDGHNFKVLDKYLTYAKNYPSSIILHVKTIKGKGLEKAQNDKLGLWHNINGIDQYGNLIVGPKTVGNYLSEELIKLHDDYSFKVVCPGMVLGCGLEEFNKTYPNDLIDVGIAEENAIAISIGLSSETVTPIVFMYSTFLSRSLDEILDASRMNKHLVICLDRCGIVQSDGETHQGIFDLSYLSMIPNIKIYSPSNIIEAKHYLSKAIEEDGLVIIRYPKVLPIGEETDNVNGFKEILPIKDINVITYGRSVDYLKGELSSLDCGLISASTILPLDFSMLEKLSNKKIIIYEESNSIGGLFDLINHYYKLNKVDANLIQVAIENTYLEVGTVDELRNKYNIGLDKLLSIIKIII